ncbi:MAG: GAF domain-containing protein, partial [Deltaproteobacteria bacterium]|nr:GAF domain-containing protein [Deltaproteobacteria bacterium]
MSFSPALVATVAFGYLLSLFAVAYWAEKRKDRGVSLISNPFVYALSIAVYCTSWTFYGSVGYASRAGFTFLAVYLGPTLIAFSWWATLRKMVRVARENHLTSITDLIASRYSKSGKIGALVTVMLVVGITPYIGLQLKAVSSTFELLTQYRPGALLQRIAGPESLLHDTAFLVALVLGVFGSMFGARSLDASERHEGMVAAVALQSLVKLVALLVVGGWVTWGLFDGPGEILRRVAHHPVFSRLLTIAGGPGESYSTWFSLLYLSSAAVMLLPRQFHVMVVENCDEGHIRDAMWLFPLYLFLINIFIVPIAFAGLLTFGGPALADTFVLRLPLGAGHPALAMLAFIGGLSAGTGMVIVSSVTLSTMLLNNLVMPVLLRLRWPGSLAPVLIHLKRAGILGIILIGYGYYRLLGESQTLINMGLISFAAAAQLAPAVVGGLWWRQATARGAATGLSLGFAAWTYMFLVPALCQSGWLPAVWLEHGPGGVEWLRPTAFLGLTGLDLWSHGLFWTFFTNVTAFVGVSLLTRPTAVELDQIPKFVNGPEKSPHGPDFRLTGAPSVEEFEGLLAKFLGLGKAHERILGFFEARHLPQSRLQSDETMLELRGFVEKTLAGAVGAAAASTVVERYLALKGTTSEEIFDVFKAVSLSLEESREELGSRVRELSVLFEASKKVVATLDEGKAISSILELIGTQFGLDCQCVYFLEKEALRPSGFDVGMGIEYDAGKRLAELNSCVAQAVVELRTIVVPDVEALRGRKPVEFVANPALKCLIATPVHQEYRALGVLVAASTQHKGYFSQKFVEAFEALAGELALAVANARLYGEVRELNRTLEEKVRARTSELQEANRNLQQLDRLKSEFLANMSHELRTPMNSILGYTQLVLDGVDGPVSEDQRVSLGRVESNAQHLLQLINDVLDLSKIEAGRLELDVQPFDLGELARRVVDDIQNLAQRKGLTCSYVIGAGDLTVEGDRGRVREVLNNLVNNA